jgi:hypothetical protein
MGATNIDFGDSSRLDAYRICPNFDPEPNFDRCRVFSLKAADAYTQLISSDFKLPKNNADTTDYDDVIDLFR